MTCRIRGEVLGPMALITFCVNAESNLEVLSVSLTSGFPPEVDAIHSGWNGKPRHVVRFSGERL
jgi:hypothetical protein